MRLILTKWKRYEFHDLQDLNETEEGFIKFQFRLGHVKEQLFVAVSENSYKNGSFYGRYLTNLYKIVKSCIIGI